MFIGRDKELKLLEEKYSAKTAQLVVIYGRRRIGKSALVDHFLQGKSHYLKFEGLENEDTKTQIEEFVRSLAKQLRDPGLAALRFDSWSDLFTYLTEKIFNSTQRKIIFLDEFQWLAVKQSKLVSLMKYYWDNHWKQQNIMLILCGSVASYMIRRVIKSKALYGRINLEILLRQLQPNQSTKLFQAKRNPEETLKYLLVFGGVPKYLEEINLKQSFKQNINRLCFDKAGFLFNESERIFYSQFKETKIYKSIINFLQASPHSFLEISQKLNFKSGGGLKLYLDNLEDAEMIRSFIPFAAGAKSKSKKYKLSDEFLVFYYKFIQPYEKDIKESCQHDWFGLTVEKQWQSWLGFAFERFCLKHAYYLAERMGFSCEFLGATPYFRKEDKAFQIDLIYKRADKVIVLCEVKYHNQAINSKIIPEIERKIALLPIPQDHSLEKALITVNGIDDALRNSEYFDYVLDVKDILDLK